MKQLHVAWSDLAMCTTFLKSVCIASASPAGQLTPIANTRRLGPPAVMVPANGQTDWTVRGVGRITSTATQNMIRTHTIGAAGNLTRCLLDLGNQLLAPSNHQIASPCSPPICYLMLGQC